jgi:hypothetical protein
MDSLILALGGSEYTPPIDSPKPHEPKEYVGNTPRLKNLRMSIISQDLSQPGKVAARSYKRLPIIEFESGQTKKPLTIKTSRFQESLKQPRILVSSDLFRRGGSIPLQKPESTKEELPTEAEARMPTLDLNGGELLTDYKDHSLSLLSMLKKVNNEDRVHNDSIGSPNPDSQKDRLPDGRITSFEEFDKLPLSTRPSDHKSPEGGKKKSLIQRDHYIESHRDSSYESDDKDKDGKSSKQASQASNKHHPVAQAVQSASSWSNFREKEIDIEKNFENKETHGLDQEGDPRPPSPKRGQGPYAASVEDKKKTGTHIPASNASIKDDHQGRMSYTSRHSEVQKPMKLAERLNKFIDQKKQTERQSYRHSSREADFIDLKSYERRSYRGPRDYYDHKPAKTEDLLARHVQNVTGLATHAPKQPREQSQSIDSNRKVSDHLISSGVNKSPGVVEKVKSKESSVDERIRLIEPQYQDDFEFIQKSPQMTNQLINQVEGNSSQRIPEINNVSKNGTNQEGTNHVSKESNQVQSYYNESETLANNTKESDRSLEPTSGAENENKLKQKFKLSIFALRKAALGCQNEVGQNPQDAKVPQEDDFYATLENLDLRRSSAELDDDSDSNNSYDQ